MVVNDGHTRNGLQKAVIKDRYNFTFYGGRTKETERHTKVKSRVMANALGELIDDAKQVYVMGHKYADMDSVGAAMGVCCIARKRGKKCQIVIDTENNAAHPLIRKMLEQPEYAAASSASASHFSTSDGSTRYCISSATSSLAEEAYGSW